MPAVDTSCYAIPPEKESGAGEMSCYKPLPSSSSSSSHIIASEIMNDIVDNAFEVIMAKSIQQTPKMEKITPNVVGDILDNILSPSSNDSVSNQTFRHDETALLDEEIKRIIKEMKFPPEQNNVMCCTQGVGDQLAHKSEVMPDKVLVEPPKRNTLERKSRLTNLVRNSKQMLAKLVINDNDNELKTSKSEEGHEEVLRVINLEMEDGGNLGDQNVGKAGGSRPEKGLLQLPSQSVMDMVNLEPNTLKKSSGNVERDAVEEEEKEIASCSFAKIESKKVINKKKWNLGTKIFKYLKKHTRKE